MKSFHTVSAVTCAFLLGIVVTSLLSGCSASSDNADPVAQVRPADNGVLANTVSPTSIGNSSAQTSTDAEPSPDVESDAEPTWDRAIDTSADSPDSGLITPGDWPQWGGTPHRNNTPIAEDIPIEWEVGKFDRRTGEWLGEGAENIKWVAQLGSQTYGNPVIADGRVYVGTNNSAGYLKRYPPDVDLGCLLCFDEQDGSFLWQASSEKLPTGRVHDWPLQGICCAPLVEGDRLWYVTSRGEVVCLDTHGFHDDQDDGPIQNELGRLFDVRKSNEPDDDIVGPGVEALADGVVTESLRERFAAAGMELPESVRVVAGEAGKGWVVEAEIRGVLRQCPITLDGPFLSAFKIITPADKDEADTIWRFDMMAELGLFQHNMCSCSVTALGDVLFVNTSNGVDESHVNIPSPDAPSFIALNRHTGELLWTDKSPGENIVHGQWSSPTVGILGGVPQVIFAGGDGWVYSFRADEGQDGQPELLWRLDANPKESRWILGGAGTRNNIIATPVIYDGRVYVAVGQDPEHGEGIGHLWCIDPTKRGDVSATLAVQADDHSAIIPHRRLQAIIEEQGETTIPNPNSAVVWHYSQYDQNQDGVIDFEEEMHRTIGTVAIKNDLLFIADFSGLFHCLDAKTGDVHWTYDMLAASWGSPLIVGDHVYIGDEDGDLTVFRLTAEKHEPIAEINMGNAIYSTPVVANGVLFISNRTHLFAIAADGE